MNKALIVSLAVLLLILLGGGWVYLTQAPSAPSQDVATGTQTATEKDSSTDSMAEQAIYRISQQDSRVRFEIDEVLRGEDFTVIGTTNQVAGDITVPDGDLQNVQFGPIRVNARTLKTDSTQRDGAIARAILRSEDAANEFVTFDVTNVTTSSENPGTGYTTLNINGDLTVTGVTKPVTFIGRFMQPSPNEIVGHAETTIRYQDFGLTIPQVPFVASVSDEVLLTIDLFALRI